VRYGMEWEGFYHLPSDRCQHLLFFSDEHGR